jgi:hypothetical protein
MRPQVLLLTRGTKGSHCCTTMTPSHADCLTHRKNATGVDGPIRCSLLTLEHEEYLQTKKTTCLVNTDISKTYKYCCSYSCVLNGTHLIICNNSRNQVESGYVRENRFGGSVVYGHITVETG